MYGLVQSDAANHALCVCVKTKKNHHLNVKGKIMVIVLCACVCPIHGLMHVFIDAFVADVGVLRDCRWIAMGSPVSKY